MRRGEGRKISSCGFDDESRLGILCRKQRESFYLLLFASRKKEKDQKWSRRDPAKAAQSDAKASS